MNQRVIRIARREGFEISPRGVYQFYAQGDHKVPDEMPVEVANRCVQSGIGKDLHPKLKTKSDKPTTAKKKKKKSRYPKKRDRVNHSETGANAS